MTTSNGRPRGWRYWVQRIISQPWATTLFAPFIHRLEMPVLRLTHGRFSFSGILAGWQTVTLTTRGAKSGLPRSLPLVGIEDGDKIVLIASNFGRPHNPSWYYNLKAHPEAQVLLHGQTTTYFAHEAEGAERQRYWEMALATYIGFACYQQRAGKRRIPVMVLEPYELTKNS